MILRVVNHNQIGVTDWAAYVDRHPYGTVFNTKAMFDVYEKTPELEPFALFCIDEFGRITGLLLAFYQSVLRGVLAPFTRRIVLMNTPIYDDDESLSLLLDFLKKKARFKSIYLEIRNHYDIGNKADIYLSKGFYLEPHLNILVDLTKDEESLWKDVSPNRRKEIKKAIKEGFEFHQNYPDARIELYPILQEIYSRARLPLLSNEYVTSIYDMSHDSFDVVSLVLGESIVGALLVLKSKKTVYGLLGGSRESYFKQRPNDLLFWSALIWAKNKGFEIFDWMGAGHPNKPYGVRDWKKQFGGEFVSYGRFYYYPSKLMFMSAERLFSLLRRQFTVPTSGR